MEKNNTKNLIVPIDGSSNSKKALKYLSLLYGPEDDIIFKLCHITADLPPLFGDPMLATEIDDYLKVIKKHNIQLSEKILHDGEVYLRQLGFKPEQIQKILKHKEVGVARDICQLAKTKQARYKGTTSAYSSQFQERRS